MKRTILLRDTLAPALALSVLFSFCPAMASAQDGGESDDAPSRTLANNSISIAARPQQSTSIAGLVDTGGDTENAAADADEQTTEQPRVAPEQEALPLGGAADHASSTQASSTAGDQAEHGGWLSSFDPRDSELLRVGGALLVVIGLLWIMRVFVKRAGLVTQSAGRPSGVLEVLARYPVGRREHLVLLKMHRRIVLVHQGDGRMSPLAEVTEPNEVAALLARVEEGSSGRQATRFKAMLNQFNAEHDEIADRAARRMPRLRRSAEDDQVVDLTRSTSPFGLLRVNRSA